ncbi:peptidylprolyl isomerase [Erythrobacter rubeus]|uniref:Parvulin-like PPIase n=1 Tax=Erythrobacter rubeus TaxID=2760803 RepID=A0ABR8KT06_9SPHN|nr:peptidylprolyl isomerase [Erythrobacter rubeus]MBD2841276.1 peptidylprolyl isomerase [Erythrobacter rubeus]
MKVFSKNYAGLIAAGLAALALPSAPIAAQNQSGSTQAQPTANNPFGIPDDFSIFDQNSTGERSATAVVNGYVITGTDIDQRVALVTAASENELSPQELERLRVQVLRNLIDETLKIQAAQALELPADRAQVEQTFNQLATQNFGRNPERMTEYLESIGSSPDALKRQIEGELAWENLLRRNITPFVNVSAEEVNDVLQRLEDSRGTEEYRLGEIYLSATQENRAEVLRNAQRIMEQLQQGGSFVAYARQFSEATTAVVGGDLGWIRLGQLPTALAAAAREMQPGQLNGPIEIPGGFSILYVINKRQVLMADPNNAVLSLRQISIEFEPDVTQEQAEARVNQFSAFIQSLRGCADADRATQELGATVVANDQITAGSLPDQLRNIILQLQVGQTTPPFGSPQEGVRVLMLCGRDDPEDVGAPTFDAVMSQIEQDRINKRAQRYLRDLRNDAYIEYN